METTNIYSPQTLTEVYMVLKTLDLINKIPKEIAEFIKENKDDTYRFYFFKEYPLEIQIERKETNEFLSYIYLKYICENSKEKEIIKKEYVKNDLGIEEKKQEKYNPNKFFDNENLINENNINNEYNTNKKELVVTENKSFFAKIINKIKNVFNIYFLK